MSEQLVLLDAGPQARRSDPPTSKAAADHAGEMSETLREFMLAAVHAEHAPITAEAIAVDTANRLRWADHKVPCHSTIVARVTTLRRLGLIVPDGTGVTSSGRSAVAYKLAGEGK